MSNPFTEAWPPVHRLILASYLVTATMALACGSKAAIAADLPLKAPEAPAYQWGGCYLGVNLGGGSSGTNFGSTVDSGTYLAAGDAATVGASGSGGANADGILAGAQAGCNFQSGTLVYGLEGDFDYFHSNPKFTNDTITLADGNTFAVVAVADNQFPCDSASADRHRGGSQSRLHHRRRGLHQHQLHRRLRRRERSARRRHRSRFAITRRLDCRRRLGICLR